LRGIDEQVSKAEKAVAGKVAGKVAIKRNRYAQLAGGTRSVNRELKARTRGLAGWRGYTTNVVDQTPEFVIGAYHPAVAHREVLPDVQARPEGKAHLMPTSA
jgi:hypothetical protein